MAVANNLNITNGNHSNVPVNIDKTALIAKQSTYSVDLWHFKTSSSTNAFLEIGNAEQGKDFV